jgi:hypothetical protein
VTTFGTVTPVARSSALRVRTPWFGWEAAYVRPVRLEVMGVDGSRTAVKVPDVQLQVRLGLGLVVVLARLMRRLSR